MVVLHKRHLAAYSFFKPLLIKVLIKKPALIAKRLGPDDFYVSDSGCNNLHQYTFSFSMRSKYWP